MIYAVDFDGTLCKEDWPREGRPKWAVIEYIKDLKAKGNKLILWTCREGNDLQKAIDWCVERGIHFDAVNDNLPEQKAYFHNNPRKLGVDYFIDDKNITIEEIERKKNERASGT